MSHQQPATDGRPQPAPPVPPAGRRLPWTDWSQRTLVLVLAGAAVAGIALVLLALAFIGSAVPRGTTVAGVDVGGRSRPAAATQLTDRLGAKLTAPITARVDDTTFTLDPRALDIRLDASATADAAATRNPFLRAAALIGHRGVRPVITVDKHKLAPVLAAQTARLGRAPEPGAVRFDGTTPVAVYPRTGRGLDADRVVTAIRANWLRGGAIRLTVTTLRPKASKADVDKALDEIARPAVSAPVSVKVGSRAVVVSPPAIAAALVLKADMDGRFTTAFDSKRLAAALAPVLGPVTVAPVDAGFKVVGGTVRVVPAVVGQRVDTAALAVDLVEVITKPAPRQVTGKLIDNVAPKLTTAKAATLGVKEQISTFTTYYPCCPTRNRNIQIVADEVDGALVMPGETFSLNGYTGPRTEAQGYVKAPVILGGKLKNEVGGGISQFATTMFNAVFFSGLEDVAHKTHSFYISRYPAGREATVYYSSVDLKFKNTSPYGVFIDTSWTNTSITVSFYSTKVYDIESVSGPRTNPTHYRTQYLGNTPGCIPTSGIDGFDITVTRVFKRGGNVVRTEQFRTRYVPETKFICSDPPASPPPSPPPGGQPGG